MSKLFSPLKRDLLLKEITYSHGSKLIPFRVTPFQIGTWYAREQTRSQVVYLVKHDRQSTRGIESP